MGGERLENCLFSVVKTTKQHYVGLFKKNQHVLTTAALESMSKFVYSLIGLEKTSQLDSKVTEPKQNVTGRPLNIHSATTYLRHFLSMSGEGSTRQVSTHIRAFQDTISNT